MKPSLLGYLGLILLVAGFANEKVVVVPGAHHFGGNLTDSWYI